MSFIGEEMIDKLKKKKAEKERLDNYRGEIESMLDRIGGMSDEAYADSEQTVGERYGDSINRVRDDVASDRAETKQTLGRVMMAQGGDVTGSGATAMADVTETGNKVIADAIRQYTDMNESAERYDKSRGDRLMSQELSGYTGMFQNEQEQRNFKKQLDLQNKQSKRQLFGDIIGAVGNVAGGFLSRPKAG